MEGWETGSYEHSFIQTIESTDKEIVETKKFDDCVSPTVKMCITQVANEIAREAGSFELCDKLSTSEEVNSCKYGVVITQLASNNSLELCESLSENYKRECRIASMTLSATIDDDSSICSPILEEFSESELENAQMRVDQCKFPIIMKKKDLTQQDCDGLVAQAQKATCIAQLKNQNSKK